MPMAVLGSVIVKPSVWQQTVTSRRFFSLFSSFSVVAAMTRTRTFTSLAWASLVLLLVLYVGCCETGSLARRISSWWDYGKSLQPKLLPKQSGFFTPNSRRIPYNSELDMTTVNSWFTTSNQDLTNYFHGTGRDYYPSWLCSGNSFCDHWGWIHLTNAPHSVQNPQQQSRIPPARRHWLGCAFPDCTQQQFTRYNQL